MILLLLFFALVFVGYLFSGRSDYEDTHSPNLYHHHEPANYYPPHYPRKRIYSPDRKYVWNHDIEDWVPNYEHERFSSLITVLVFAVLIILVLVPHFVK